MLEDVLTTLQQVPAIAGILLVSDDPGAELLAHKYRLETVTESSLGCAGLNAVISAGIDLLQGRGIEDVLVVHGDLPLLQAADVEAMLALYQQPQVEVVLAPDLAGSGTNGMLFATGRRPQLHYGIGSCAAHQSSAEALGMVCRVLHNPRLGLDIDQPGDLLHLYHQLQGGVGAGYSSRLLLGAEVAQRLSIMERSGLTMDVELDSYDAV